jgi:hypothetical protein
MIPTQIQNNIVRVDTPAVYAFYIVKTSVFYPLALVCDENDVLVGVIGNKELQPRLGDISQKSCGQICNRNFMFLKNEDDDSIYGKARNIFAEKELQTLPIVDGSGGPVRMFGRFQAFFKERYKSLRYPHYAEGLMESANLAKGRGYDRISCIEFGVAGGFGLTTLELYAREVSRLTGINIDVFGFDSGAGMFPPVDYRDCPQIWIAGDYKMDFDGLQKKLYSAKLVIGNICKTTKTFLTDYNVSPIGFISVDVDQYTPTVAILDMLLEDEKYFLPIISMYFDDIANNTEFQGESLAIKEFNAKSESVKISPEYTGFYSPNNNNCVRYFQKLKYCNRFNHPLFATRRVDNMSLPLFR